MTMLRLFIVSSVILFASQTHAQNSVSRTVLEINDLIAQEGKKPPDWWASVKLEYPETLNLDIPDYVPGIEWDNQRYVRAYVREIIKPNPHRWRSGIKLYHSLVIRHKDDEKNRLKESSTD